MTPAVSASVGIATNFSRIWTTPMPSAVPIKAPTTGQANVHQVPSAISRTIRAAIRPKMTTVSLMSMGCAPGSWPPSSI